MTKNKAIIRKLIYQGITLLPLLIVGYIYYDSLGIAPEDYALFSVAFLPILITIIICKLIRTVVYIVNIYKSDIEFEKYSDTKKSLSFKSKFINILAIALSVIIILTITTSTWINQIIVYSNGYDEMEKDNGLNAISFENLSNMNEDGMTLNSDWIYFSKVFNSMGYYKRLNYENYTLICSCMNNCPKWAVNAVYEGNVNTFNKSDDVEIFEIKEDGVSGFYSLNNKSTQLEILVKENDDYLNIYIGGRDNDTIIVDYEKAIDYAVEWIKNN